jgi:hypothetical protein
MSNISWFEWISLAVGVIGTLVGILGYAASLEQKRKAENILRNQKYQFISLLERANYVGFEHELFDELAQSLYDKVGFRYLATAFQAAVDLYLMMVSYYLQNEENFTYDDLRKLCNTPVIDKKWQEEYWRTLVSVRPENKASSAPTELFVRDDSGKRTKYYRTQSALHSPTSQPPTNHDKAD